MTEDNMKLDAQDENKVLEDRSTLDGLDKEMDSESEEELVPISELRKVRYEAAKYRKQLRQLEGKVESERRKSELSKMEETDRLKAIAAEAEAEANSLRRKVDALSKQSAVINAASSLGFYNPKDAAAIINMEQIEADDDGNVDAEMVNEIVKSMAESKPYLLRGQIESQDMAGFGPTNPASDNLPKPKLRTKDRIGQLKEQASMVMRGGRMSEAIKLYNQAWEMERGMKRPKGGQK